MSVEIDMSEFNERPNRIFFFGSFINLRTDQSVFLNEIYFCVSNIAFLINLHLSQLDATKFFGPCVITNNITLVWASFAIMRISDLELQVFNSIQSIRNSTSANC